MRGPHPQARAAGLSLLADLRTVDDDALAFIRNLKPTCHCGMFDCRPCAAHLIQIERKGFSKTKHHE